MKSLRNTALGLAMGITGATGAFADGHTELTIAIVNNGHMINMQTVAEAYTAETGVELNWVSRLLLTQQPVVVSTTSSTSACKKLQSGVLLVGLSH